MEGTKKVEQKCEESEAGEQHVGGREGEIEESGEQQGGTDLRRHVCTSADDSYTQVHRNNLQPPYPTPLPSQSHSELSTQQ